LVRAAELVALSATLIALGSVASVLGNADDWFWMNTSGQPYTS
jgi:hypothetical protein